MGDQVVKLMITAAALLVHGLGHGGALGALVWIWRLPTTDTGGWRAARTWLIPWLAPRAASLVAGTFWVVAMVGFVAATMAFWGFVLPGSLLIPLAAASAVVSLIAP